MKCEECKDQEECSYYQEWLNTRDCCCPYSDYQQEIKKNKGRRVYLAYCLLRGYKKDLKELK